MGPEGEAANGIVMLLCPNCSTRLPRRYLRLRGKPFCKCRLCGKLIELDKISVRRARSHLLLAAVPALVAIALPWAANEARLWLPTDTDYFLISGVISVVAILWVVFARRMFFDKELKIRGDYA